MASSSEKSSGSTGGCFKRALCFIPHKGSILNYFMLGSQISLWETLVMYSLPVFHAFSVHWWAFAVHAGAQFLLFLLLVCIPACITKRMSYVDIGWPWGLVLLAVFVAVTGDGWAPRRYASMVVMLLHGGRMALGSAIFFYPYKFPQDFPRYRYAKQRWIVREKMPASSWGFKMQHDLIQQAYANSVILATPFLLQANNPSTWLNPVEVCGWILFLVCWVLEQKADSQKTRFLRDAKKMMAEANSEARKTELKLSVLGFGEFAGPRYSMWSWCRHPNYFFEWMCWNCHVLAAIPSLVDMARFETEPIWVIVGLAVANLFVSRTFYDCLVYWTGAEPAEYYSVLKRPNFASYQEQINVFFPKALGKCLCCNHSCLHMYRRQSRWAVIQMEEDDAGDGTADAAGSKEPPLFRPRKKNEVMPVSESAAAGHLGPVPTASAPGASRLESVPRI